MAKFWTYTVMVAGLMIFFYFAGLTTLSGRVLEFTMATIQNYKTSWIWIGVALLFIAFAATAVKISAVVISTQATEVTVRALFASVYLILFIGDLISITKTAYEGAGYFSVIIWAIMIPLIYGYILAMIDWIGGHD